MKRRRRIGRRENKKTRAEGRGREGREISEPRQSYGQPMKKQERKSKKSWLLVKPSVL